MPGEQIDSLGGRRSITNNGAIQIAPIPKDAMLRLNSQ